MKIAMTDMNIAWEDKEENRKQCRILIEEAAENGADCILFPEMTLTGFSMAVEKIQDRDKESVLFFSELAAQYEIGVGFGYVTLEAGKGRNHFCFLDEQGRVLVDYEKIHPFTYGEEAKYYKGGDKIRSFEWRGFTCGVFICYDLRFPEAFQQLPKETDAVFLIANWPESRLEHWYALLKARAIEMQSYIIGINRTGEGGGLRYEESSVAFSPEGRRLDEMSGKANRYVEISRDCRLAYVNQFPTRADRRPEVYGVK